MCIRDSCTPLLVTYDVKVTQNPNHHHFNCQRMEHHEGKQTCRRSDGENTRKLVDRLRSLPRQILAEILSFLPLKSVVASATLSRQWRTLWTHLTILRYYSFIPPCIDSFSICVFQMRGDHVKIIDMIAICVSDFPDTLIPPPSCVFECQTLETHILGIGFDLKLPDNGIRLPNLKNLHVHVVLISSIM